MGDPIYTGEARLTRSEGVSQLINAESGFNPNLANGPHPLIRVATSASVGISAVSETGSRKLLRQGRQAGPGSHTGCHRAWAHRWCHPAGSHSHEPRSLFL